MAKDEKLPYEIPPYPAVIFLAKTKHIRYEGRQDGDEVGKNQEYDLEYLHHKVTSDADMEHIDYCRNHLGYAVVGHHGLETLVDGKTGQLLESTKKMIVALNNIVNPPEGRLRREAEEKAAALAVEEEKVNTKKALAERAARVKADA